MLLRVSSAAIGVTPDPAAVLDGDGDPGVAHGAVLTAYATAAHRGDGLAAATAAVRSALGDDGWVEAALTVAVFNGLVRTADASGIPLDVGVVSATAQDRELLGLARYAGAEHSDLTIAPGAAPHPSRFN
jgi:hypothetical protein